MIQCYIPLEGEGAMMKISNKNTGQDIEQK
jgi:hypothetical protein